MLVISARETSGASARITNVSRAILLTVLAACAPPTHTETFALGRPTEVGVRARDPAERKCVADAGANQGCLTVVLDSQMSPAFVMTSVEVEVDGALVYMQRNAAALANARTLDVARSLAYGGGSHEVNVRVMLTPAPSSTPWVEASRYRFDVKSAKAITVTNGGVLDVRIVPYEKGGVTAPIEERPAIRWEVHGV